ncbi:DNA double-strand break repair nuclease NurA [Isosphaeraceae bacterium EP7]
MGFSSKNGRPYEFASKTSHTHVINDAEVKAFLAGCDLPRPGEDVHVPGDRCVRVPPLATNPIKHIIAVDGGYSEVAVQKKFPSATVCFFQFGVLKFAVNDLEAIGLQPFIEPDDIAKLKRIERLKLVIPVRNVTTKGDATLTQSVRRSVYDFYAKNPSDDRLIETLKWLVFQEYGEKRSVWPLASCPGCGARQVPLERSKMRKDHTFDCPECAGKLYLTDVLRLHEAIDDELGAGGMLAYLMTATEQMLLVHLIRIILRTKPSLLSQIMLIKDGPLAYFGQTANLHEPMRELIRHLLKKHNIYMVGLEKSGGFVEHADEIAERLEPGTALLLDDEYIYRYIIPGKADPKEPYGRSTYYSHKVIFKTETGQLHVVSIPTTEANWKLAPAAYPNLSLLLQNVAKLKCDMYDNALMPIALVNKLVSLADHPSSRILEQFAIESMGL